MQVYWFQLVRFCYNPDISQRSSSSLTVSILMITAVTTMDDKTRSLIVGCIARIQQTVLYNVLSRNNIYALAHDRSVYH